MKHAHKYKFKSFEVNGHKHRMMGFTGYNIPLCFTHVHYYRGVCSYEGHTHNFSGITGLPHKTENGHFHIMSGYLIFCNNHEHEYYNRTDENVEYSGKREELKVLKIKY